MLSFQKLDVYRCAIEFLGLAAAAAEEVPRGNAALLDQLRRAASSIPLDIAEAAGRTRQGRCRTYLRHRSRVCDGVRGCAGGVVRAEGCRCHDKAARRRPPRTYRRDAHAIVSVI